MATKKKTAEELIELLTESIEETKTAAKTEVMKYKAEEIAKLAKQPVRDLMTLAEECEIPVDWPADANSFRAGIAFAAQLFADPNFDY